MKPIKFGPILNEIGAVLISQWFKGKLEKVPRLCKKSCA